jgi:hypothetical protein
LFVSAKYGVAIPRYKIFMEVLPVFESVTVRAGDVTFRSSWPNERLDGESVTVGVKPVPVRLTLCGLPLALSVTVSDAVRVPDADGVNVTLIVQLAPAATLLPQLLVWAKSPEFVPLMPMFEMSNVAFPVLERVTFWGVLVVPVYCWPNERLDGESVTAGATPVPIRLTLWGLPLALSAMASEALRAPVADGVNVTLIVQFAPAPTVLTQLFVWAKSPGLVPPSVTLDMLRGALPEFERVTACAALVVPTPCGLNMRLAVETATRGAGGGLPPPPPPQATQTPTTTNALASTKAAARRRLAARLVSTARHSINANIQSLPSSA